MTERETTLQAMADEKTFTFYSSERKWIDRILNLNKEYPDDIKITAQDEFSITAEIPKRYMRIRPPRSVNYTEEQRQAMAERMKKIRSHYKKEE